MNKWSPETARAYAGLGEQSHVAVLEPTLRKLCANLDGRNVLDFGCGGGELSLRLADWGAAKVTCIDEQPSMIERLRRTIEASPHAAERFDVHLGGQDRLDSLGRYDLVLCSLMLMMCESRDRLDRVTAALMACVTDAGRLLIVLTHPCFRRAPYPTFRYDLPAAFDYWSSGIAYNVMLDPPSAPGPVVITDYHWMIQDYVAAIHAAAGVTRQILELPGGYDADGAPRGAPAYLVMEVERPRQQP